MGVESPWRDGIPRDLDDFLEDLGLEILEDLDEFWDSWVVRFGVLCAPVGVHSRSFKVHPRLSKYGGLEN